MIKNERQYRITHAQAERFAQALQSARERSGVSPLLRKIEQDALRSQLDELREELQEYERLRSGRRRTIAVDSFEDLPRALVQARIAAGLSQKDLAHRLRLKEQQVQRYEASDYASASMSRIRQVMQALGVTLRGRVGAVKE
jgi:ribosome-binding protein aMBF1 (putative translation factor)